MIYLINNLRLASFLLLMALTLLSCQEAKDDVISQTLAPTTAKPTPVIGLAITIRPTDTEITIAVLGTLTPKTALETTPDHLIYIIKSGDTLVDIAARFSTTVIQIEALNPGLDSDLLQVGKELLIPDSNETADERTPEPLKNVSNGLLIQGLAFYEAPLNAIWVLGSLKNETGKLLGPVKLKIIILDDERNVITETEVLAQPDVIFPGELGAFASQFKDLNPASIAVEASISDVWLEANPFIRSEGLTLDSPVAAVNGNKVSYSGMIVNSGNESFNGLSVLALFFDDEGQVSGYQLSEIETMLAPGESYSFRSESVVPGERPKMTEFVVQGTIADN